MGHPEKDWCYGRASGHRALCVGFVSHFFFNSKNIISSYHRLVGCTVSDQIQNLIEAVYVVPSLISLSNISLGIRLSQFLETESLL